MISSRIQKNWTHCEDGPQDLSAGSWEREKHRKTKRRHEQEVESNIHCTVQYCTYMSIRIIYFYKNYFAYHAIHLTMDTMYAIVTK